MADEAQPPGKKKRTSAEKRARTAFLKAAREARQRTLEATWKAQVAEHFGFLESEYGFRFVSVDGSNWWGTEARYRSPLLQIVIDRSVESNGVELYLDRLVDGEVRPYPPEYHLGMPVRRIYFISVLSERIPKAQQQLKALKGLCDKQLERTLDYHANALRILCEDLLRGDLTMFDVETERRRQYALE